MTINAHNTVIFRYEMFSFCSCLDIDVFCHVTASHAPTIPKIIAETIKRESKNNNISETKMLLPKRNENTPIRKTRIPKINQTFFFNLTPLPIHLYTNRAIPIVFAG